MAGGMSENEMVITEGKVPKHQPSLVSYYEGDSVYYEEDGFNGRRMDQTILEFCNSFGKIMSG